MRLFALTAAAAALASVAAPAFAQDTTATTTATGTFTGLRAGGLVGTGGNKFVDFDGQTVGIDAGYDVEIGNGGVIGVGVEYQTDIGSNFLDVNESAVLARVGGLASANTLVYASGGYTRVSNGATPFNDNGEDGYRVGLGVEHRIGVSGLALKLEQRYLSYGHGVDAFQTVGGVGFHF
jgi:hypothetical protein